MRARLSGIRTNTWGWISFLVSGGIAGLAGVLYVSLTGPSVSVRQLVGAAGVRCGLPGVDADQAGRFNVLGTVLAIFVLATGVLGLQLLTNISWINDMFNGVAVIAAVALAVARRPGVARRTRRARPGTLTEDLSVEGAEGATQIEPPSLQHS